MSQEFDSPTFLQCHRSAQAMRDARSSEHVRPSRYNYKLMQDSSPGGGTVLHDGRAEFDSLVLYQMLVPLAGLV